MKNLNIPAPAKINLYLHVTGRQADGYHTLDSLAVFADTGDEITLSPASDFEFEMNGPFAKALDGSDLKSTPDSTNLAVRAAHALAQKTGRPLNVRLTLTKNLPPASGMGGGSADAAAVLRGLLQWWGMEGREDLALPIAAALGADVPLCFAARPARIVGASEITTDIPALPEMAALLINPGKACSTAEVFARRTGDFRTPVKLPANFKTAEDLMNFLQQQHNDLDTPACALVPEIGKVLEALSKQKGCGLARLSGSGATCFGLFENLKMAQNTAMVMKMNNPHWWVKACLLNPGAKTPDQSPAYEIEPD